MDTTHPDIIFLQENLVHEKKNQSFMINFNGTWVSCAVSYVGTLGGLFISWDRYIFNLVPYLTCGGIWLIGYVISTKREINLLNIYGSCLEHKIF
jgi:hypothetical protein